MSEILSEESRTANVKTRDSVFTLLFRDVDNVYRLYKELHTEDTTTTVEDIQIDTLETILVNDIHNDLGFLVNHNGKAKYVVLMEAQTKWTDNMTLRIFLYLAETYRRYLIKTKQSEHSTKRVHLPKPELYIVYTGDEEIAPQISFKDTYFDGDAPIDLTVNILRTSDKNTLYGQYIAFSKVYTEQREIYKNKIDCIKRTLDICIQNGYLRDFLEQHRQEVVTMLSSLFDEKAQREQYDIASKEEAKAEGILQTLIGLVKKGLLTRTQAAEQANMTVEDFDKQCSKWTIS